MDAGMLADELEQELAALGDPARAEKERAYLKSDLPFLGVGVPAVRKAATRLIRAHPDLDHDGLVALVEALWEEPVHERRFAATELLDLRSDVLGPDDLPLLERLLRESRTWALVDGLAASVVGTVRERHLDEVEPVLEAWSRDADHWIRRASLLAYLVALREGRDGFEGFARKADRMLEEREFFVRKAIGWVLRDTGKRRPELVVGWLEPRAARAAGLTIREAVKHLPPDDRARILAAVAGRAAGPSADAPHDGPRPEPPGSDGLPYTADDAATATERVRAICAQLPEVTERRNHGFASFFVRDKRQVCYVSDDHHGDGRLALIAAAPDGVQEELVRSEPHRFYRPPYVGHRGWIGLRLDVDPDWGEVASVIEEAYRLVAPATLVRQLDRA